MTFHPLFLLLLLLPFSLSQEDTSSNSSNNTEIFENYQETLMLSHSQFLYRKFIVSALSSSKEVGIALLPMNLRHPTGELSIFFSETNEFPSGNNNTKKCLNLKTLNSCVLEVPQNKTTSEIYIGLYCESESCAFKFRLNHIEEIQLRWGDYQVFSFYKEEFENFNITIPNKESFNRIIFIIEYKYIPAEYQIKDEVKFSSGTPLSKKLADRHILILTNNDSSLCYNCNITATIFLPKTSVITVELELFTSVWNKIYMYQIATDFLFSKSNNCYILTLNETLMKSDDFRLLINFKSLSGTKKTIYVSSTNETQDLSKAEWNSSMINNFYEEADISINRKELIELGIKSNILYLTVVGDINGLYMMHFNIFQQRMIPINYEIIESGLIENGEIVNYNYEHWKSDENDNLIVTTTIATGHLDIYIRKCREYKQYEMITKEDIESNNNINYKLTQNGLNMLEFPPDCNFTNYLVCYFNIAIVGNSSSSKLTKYSFLLKRAKSEIVLIENVFHESHLKLYSSEVFKLIVEDHANSEHEVKSIAFLINQDLTYYVTKEKICYELDESNCYVEMGNKLNPVVFQKNDSNDLSGIYYLTLIGMQRTNILIYPKVVRKGDGLNFIKLAEGKSFQSSLGESMPWEYFQFHISVDISTLVEINIETSISHGLRIYITNSEDIPGPDHYFLSSQNNYLSFHHSPSDNHRIYKIGLQIDEKSNQKEKVDFAIMYSTEATIKHLEADHLFYDYLEPKKIKNFIFFVGLEQDTIILSKHVMMPPGAEEFLKVNLSIFLKPNQFHQEVSAKNDISINKSLLSQICGKSDKIDECPFFVTIENTYDDLIHFSLLLRHKQHSINLVDGKEQAFVLDEEKQIFMHYYPTRKDEDIDVFSYSYGINYDLYFRIYRNVDKTNLYEWPFMDLQNSSSSLRYLHKNNYYFSLKASNFNSCWPNCVVLIALVVNTTKFNIPTPRIHLMLSSKISQLIETRPIMISIEKNQAKFFNYDLTHFINTAAQTISLDLTNFFGEAQFYLTINSFGTHRLPNLGIFDYMSQTGSLLLSKQDLLRINSNLTQSPKLLIAVYCVSSSCETSLSLNTANYPLKSIINGRPIMIFMGKTDYQRYQYIHYQKKDFQVKFNKESGMAIMKVFPCHFNISFEECTKKEVLNKDNVDFGQSWANSIKIKKTDQDFCLDCAYIIVFQSVTGLKGSLNIILEDEFLYLQEGKKLLDDVLENDNNLYMIKFHSNTEIKIIVNVYAGSPQVYVSNQPKINHKDYEIFSDKNNNSQINITYKAPIDRYAINQETSSHVYIQVYGKEHSHYSISYRTEVSTVYLHEGLIEFDSISGGKSTKYVFEIYHQETRPTLSLNLKKEHGMELLKFELFFKDQKNIYDLNNQLSNVMLSKDDMILSSNSLILSLLNKTGHYEMKLTNMNEEELDYSIIVNTQYIHMIPHNSVLNQIIPNDQALYYETYAPNKGFLMFDLLQCVGEVKLFVSEDYEQFKKARFDEEFQGTEGVSRTNIIKVNQGMVYFALFDSNFYNRKYNGMGLENREKGYFRLVTHFYDSPEEIPENKLAPGNNGRIIWSYMPGTNNIKVSFEPIRCIGLCPEYLKKYLSISYFIMISKNENLLNAYGKCSIVSYGTPKNNTNNFHSYLIAANGLSNSNEIEYQFTKLNDNDVHYVSVKARVQNYPGSFNQPFYMYYEDIEIAKPVTQRVFYYGLTIMAIVLVVFLAFFGCYYYRGFKKLEEGLNYEVKDLDDPGTIITTLNASIEMQPNKRYRGLIEESSNI